MSDNAKQILTEVVEQRRTESMPELSQQDYFEIFSAEQVIKDFSPSLEELEAGIVDGEHDGGLDAVFTFINGDLFHEDTDLSVYKRPVEIDLIIIQSKTSGGFSEEPINRIISSTKNLLRLDADYEKLTQYNDGVKTALDKFRTAYRLLLLRFPKLRITVFYSAMKADSDIHKNLQIKKEELISSIQNLFDEAEVKFSFLGAKEILSLARQQPNEVFALNFSKSLTGEDGYVVLATLKKFNQFLRDGEDTVRHDLFESNVRDFQGTTEVNTDISATLKDDADIDFWWLNNGITVLSSRATLAGNTISIENPQIVNGLQTSSQIAKYFDDGGDDDTRMVMVKIVSSEDEAVRDQIIKATNSQNSVPRASLRATDKVQRDIEHALKMGGYYYDRRKNYYKNQGKPAAKIVSIPLLAQAMMTLLRSEPDNARARPSSLIKEDSVYEELFSESYPINAYLVASDLIKRIEIALKQRNELAARDRNNLRFYVLLWSVGWASKSTELTAAKLAKQKGKVSDSDIELAIDKVSGLFFDEGGSDQLAKGPDFKKSLLAQLDSEIKGHFGSSDGDDVKIMPA